MPSRRSSPRSSGARGRLRRDVAGCWCALFADAEPRRPAARRRLGGRLRRRVLPLFEAEAPADDRPRDAIARARAFARGELDAAGEIRRRFVAGRAAHSVTSPAAKAAAWAAAQASGVAHMGAHALGAAAYAAKAAGASDPTENDCGAAEIAWQIEHMSDAVKVALGRLPCSGTIPPARSARDSWHQANSERTSATSRPPYRRRADALTHTP